MFGGKRPARAASSVRHLLKRGAAKLGRLGRHDGGTVVVIAGIIFPVVVGGMGLGVETGYWYFTQRKLQHAADVSVYAAAVRMSQGDGATEYEKAALRVAEEAGFKTSAGTISVNSPPQAPSTNAGKPDHVQVILTESMPLLFSSIFTGEPLTLTGHAVASVEVGTDGCVLALSRTAPAAVSFVGSPDVRLHGCDVASNSNSPIDAFSMTGSAKLTTGCVHSVGGAYVHQPLNLTLTDEIEGAGPCKDGQPNEHARTTADPYADVPNPSVEGLPCTNNANVGTNNGETITPIGTHSSGMPAKRFCNGLRARANGLVNFERGLYFIEGGDFTINANAVVSGEEITFVLLNGASLNFAGNATVNLSAPTWPEDNPFLGILFFSDRNDSTASHIVTGDNASNFTGAIYAPTTSISFRGNAASGGGGCTQIIGDTVEFRGNPQIGSNCKDKGTRNMRFGQQIAIVE